MDSSIFLYIFTFILSKIAVGRQTKSNYNQRCDNRSVKDVDYIQRIKNYIFLFKLAITPNKAIQLLKSKELRKRGN